MSDPYVALGAFLAPTEAGALAARLAARQSLTTALQAISSARRTQARTLLLAAGLGPDAVDVSVAVLRAIEGSAEHDSPVTASWTLPGTTEGYGYLTTSIRDMVLSAQESVVCSTYNFERSSVLWEALAEVAAREYVTVIIYIDGVVARPEDVSRHLPGAHVHASPTVNGYHIRNHAKFVSVDHRFLIVTSANFSKSAEHFNVELGLRVDDPRLALQVEDATHELWRTHFVALG